METWKGKNCKLRITIAVLKMQLEESEKENSQLIGTIKIKESDLSKAYEIISTHSENIENVVLEKFNQLKSKKIQEIVTDKVKIIEEDLKKQKDKELIEYFEFLGVPEEKLNKIIKKISNH